MDILLKGKEEQSFFGYIGSTGDVRDLLLENVKAPSNCNTNCMGAVVARNYGWIERVGVKSGSLTGKNSSYPEQNNNTYNMSIGGIVGLNANHIVDIIKRI